MRSLNQPEAEETRPDLPESEFLSLLPGPGISLDGLGQLHWKCWCAMEGKAGMEARSGIFYVDT